MLRSHIAQCLLMAWEPLSVTGYELLSVICGGRFVARIVCSEQIVLITALHVNSSDEMKAWKRQHLGPRSWERKISVIDEILSCAKYVFFFSPISVDMRCEYMFHRMIWSVIAQWSTEIGIDAWGAQWCVWYSVWPRFVRIGISKTAKSFSIVAIFHLNYWRVQHVTATSQIGAFGSRHGTTTTHIRPMKASTVVTRNQSKGGFRHRRAPLTLTSSPIFTCALPTAV